MFNKNAIKRPKLYLVGLELAPFFRPDPGPSSNFSATPPPGASLIYIYIYQGYLGGGGAKDPFWGSLWGGGQRPIFGAEGAANFFRAFFETLFNKNAIKTEILV